ncbi:HAD family hydrolase [Sphingomonas sp. GC_Shp_3]|uniref:HAD family hydrolase n=1 Tax=Sphingomonas sp. GC_Shp_3 TaxID=2937383 RepID=UPI00226A64F3|nr:HAD family hydrolase [Sphingomonas sp. GC_Shp_3]
MFILHLALGGCLHAPPVAFGITADTGGHIAYVMDAALAQVRHNGMTHVSIVTRLFEDARLSPRHACVSEVLAENVTIDRIATEDRRYLEKEALAADLNAFTEAFCSHIARLPRRPDVIHAHFADAAAVAITARQRFGIPFVYTPHALGIDKRVQGCAGDGMDARIQAERTALAAADGIIVSTHDEAERQVRAYGVAVDGRIHCLPPGVPQRPAPNGATTLAERLGEWLDAPEKPIILAIARPVAKKNLVALIRAFAATPALRDRANLVILAGQHDRSCTPEEQGVLTEMRALGADPVLRGRMVLPRAHDADDVSALYALAARGGVFVNPALHEPFGLTLIEAAAMGVPVVATGNGGPREIVETIGHGLLVDPRDDAAIAQACLAIIADPALHRRFSDAAIGQVGAYDWSRYAAGSLAVYDEIGTVRPALLACDIDNTLTGCASGAQAFAEWRTASAFPFVVATGRSFNAARAVLRQWQLPDPDAYIVDVGTRMMIADHTGRWTACPAYHAALDHDWDRAGVVKALAPLGIEPQPVETEGPHKLSFFGTAADALRIRTTLAAAGLGARVIFSHGRLIDVIAPMGGKAAAVGAYAARHGLSLAQCIAAGDSGNDADMLEACGRAIVVANASDELATLTPRSGLHRARARHAAGVMEGLERLGLTAPVTVAA